MIRSILTAASLFTIVSVPAGAEESSFRFPGGDAEAGRVAFMSLNCNQCHNVAEIVLDEPAGERRLELVLGAEPRWVTSYEDLILAITNPKHVVTEQYREILSSPELAGEIEPLMPSLVDDMSARQLIDLVTFLDAAYRESMSSYGHDEGEKAAEPVN